MFDSLSHSHYYRDKRFRKKKVNIIEIIYLSKIRKDTEKHDNHIQSRGNII